MKNNIKRVIKISRRSFAKGKKKNQNKKKKIKNILKFQRQQFTGLIEKQNFNSKSKTI